MLLVFAFGLVGAAKPASAQLNYQLGYQFLRLTNDEGANYPLGFDVNAGFPLRSMGPLHVIGDVSWGRHSESEGGIDATATELTFGAGLRYLPPMMPRLGFQAVAGISRDSFSVSEFEEFDSSESNLFIQPGVQFTVPVNDNWNMVVGGHFRLVTSEGDSGKLLVLTVGLGSR